MPQSVYVQAATRQWHLLVSSSCRQQIWAEWTKSAYIWTEWSEI